MGQTPTLHLLYSCPFCWKVRSLLEHLDVDVDYVAVNGMKIKKAVSFAGDWGKVPVFTDTEGEHHVDSTPIMRVIDEKYNGGKMANQGDPERQSEWMAWVDTHLSRATVPILYGSLGSALKNRKFRIHLKAPVCVGRLPHHVGHHRTEAREKRRP